MTSNMSNADSKSRTRAITSNSYAFQASNPFTFAEMYGCYFPTAAANAFWVTPCSDMRPLMTRAKSKVNCDTAGSCFLVAMPRDYQRHATHRK